MLKKLSIKFQILLLLIAVVASSVIIYTKISIDYTEKTEFEEIDHLLTAVVYGAQNIVGDDYHDVITDSTSISNELYLEVIEKLSVLAQKSNVKEIYSYIDFNGELRFTASSILNYGTDSNIVSPFFDKYADDPVLAEKIYYKPLKNNSIFYLSYEDVYGEVRSAFVPFVTSNGKKYVIGADLSAEYIDELAGMIKNTYFFVGAGILTFALLLSFVLIIQISKPLKFLVAVKRELSENNFVLSGRNQSKLENMAHTYEGEIGKLSQAFVHMQSSLKDYIINLSETTKAKEKIESQLRIASSIQMGMIPKEFEGFPEHKEFNICGFMKPAREVGGDLYNFFMIDDEHLGFTIGDVSDKGIPAALFMAMTNTLIKAIALTGISPAEVLSKVNNELCKENEQGMFVTLFLAKLNIRSGVVEYSNAGHNPFILVKNNKVEYQKLASGMVLAAFEDFDYTNEYLNLASGDALLMYTDGVTEAMNADLKLYGEARLIEVVNLSPNVAVTGLIEDIIKSVENYVERHEQSDDITLLAMRFIN
jgi:phosphoserine phosphatase RsbU/P